MLSHCFHTWSDEVWSRIFNTWSDEVWSRMFHNLPGATRSGPGFSTPGATGSGPGFSSPGATRSGPGFFTPTWSDGAWSRMFIPGRRCFLHDLSTPRRLRRHGVAAGLSGGTLFFTPNLITLQRDLDRDASHHQRSPPSAIAFLTPGSMMRHNDSVSSADTLLKS